MAEDALFEFDDNCKKDFDEWKKRLTSAPIV